MVRLCKTIFIVLGLATVSDAAIGQTLNSNHDARVLPRSHASVNNAPSDPRTQPGRGLESAESSRSHYQANVSVPSEAQPAAESSESRGRFPSLTPRSPSSTDSGNRNLASKPFSGSIVTVGCSLGVVLGLFAALVWVTRRFGNRSMAHGAIPAEVLQPLGSAPIDARTTLTMVRCGNRVLVLARTPTGIQPITEITDPKEVRHVTALCLGDAKKEFASTLQAIEREETPSGYVGASPEKPTPRSSGRLFATA